MKLLELELGRNVAHEDFCRAFEQTYNFGLESGDLSPTEDRVLRELFDTVAWFTPIRKERDELPTHFKNEKDVEVALAKAKAELGIRTQQ